MRARTPRDNDDSDDVRLRGATHRQWQSGEQADAARIRTLLHRRRDQILDGLRDPATPSARRHILEAMHARVNSAIREAGPGASMRTLRDLEREWR